ncbi:MAG: hypothetical protein Q8K82_20160 [Gemmatimonadaceae bacterium]|nr:hypothetical protein [Gemmatimonadaceae bacterium]
MTILRRILDRASIALGVIAPFAGLSCTATPTADPGGVDEPALEAPPAAESTTAKPTRTAVTSGYASLAANLADPLLAEADQQPLHKELPQLIAEAKVRIARYKAVGTSDGLLHRAAQDAAEAGNAMVQSQEALDGMAQDGGFNEVVAAAFGYFTGQPAVILGAVGELLNKGDQRQQERIKFAAALNRSRAAQLMLPEAAKAYAGAASTSGDIVSIDFDESFAGEGDTDKIVLVNTSGHELTHCTVLVEIRGKDGDVRQNVHYLDAWEAGGARFARYGIGIESDSGVYGRRTVYGVQEVRLSAWADEARMEEFVYRYSGAERDKDLAAQLDGKMVIAAHYYGSGRRGGPSRRIVLVLDGVQEIPAHTLTLVATQAGHDAQRVPAASSQTRWRRSERRSFELDRTFPLDPDALEIVITFPDISYEYRRTVAVRTE